MEPQEIILTVISAVIPAIISYFVARHQGKTDIKKATETNKAEIERLIKQHEINLEAIKEQHRLEMETKEKDQEFKLQLMQKEFDLKLQGQQQTKANDMMTNMFGGIIGDLIKDPAGTTQKLQELQNAAELFKNQK